MRQECRRFAFYNSVVRWSAVPLIRKKPRERRLTAQHVADRAGVSISAVSRAFTPGASVAPTTRSKILRAAQALGYQPNVMARSLMTGRTELIGLVSNNFNNPAYMEIFDLFTRRLQDHGLRPLLANLSGNSDPEKAIAMLRQYSVDGVIVASSTISPVFINGCLAADIPVVHAFGKSYDHSVVHTVSADNMQGGRLAATIMLNHGYRHIAFLGGPRFATSTADRLRGFRYGLKQGGLSLDIEMFANSYSHEDGRQLMHLILADKEIEAVFCGDDILAVGALDACKECGRSVPGDIGILGFNDIEMASWAAYDLSTIRQPIADIIVAAVEISIRIVSDQKIPVEAQLFPCIPVLRRTLRHI
jgi:DNA-binding LacI/PurR family transcriptional regulator